MVQLGPAQSLTSRIQYESAFGRSEIQALDLGILSQVSGLSEGACLAKLSAYRLDDLAASWRQQSPQTVDEILRFYSETDQYLWELTAWNGSAAYEPYWSSIEGLLDSFPNERLPRALDYGCGVGSVALVLAEKGYQVTLAEIPGKTLRFAQARLRERSLPFETFDISSAVPALAKDRWDMLISFDVLEHVVRPADLARTLVRALRTGGGAAVMASFGSGTDPRWPHHLPSGVARFKGHRWDLFFHSLGMQSIGKMNYRKLNRRQTTARRLQYAFWRASGLWVRPLPR